MRTLCSCAALLGAALFAVAARGDVATTTLTRIHAGTQPCAEIGGVGSGWVADYGGAMLTRVDPKTNRVVGHVRVGSQPCGLTVGAGSIWVDGYGTDRVERVDPVRMKVVARIETGPGVWDVAWDGRYVWAD